MLLPKRKAEYFLARGLDSSVSDLPVEATSGAARSGAVEFSVIPRESRKRGIQYAAVYRFIAEVLQYWITRFRG